MGAIAARLLIALCAASVGAATVLRLLEDTPRFTVTNGFPARSALVIASAEAQAPEKAPIKTFSVPEETPTQQLLRGLTGSRTDQRTWFVIAGSHVRVEDAQRQAEEFTKKGFPAYVYAPYRGNPHYAVVIGANVTAREAQDLTAKARAAGLPKDTYPWTFPK